MQVQTSACEALLQDWKPLLEEYFGQPLYKDWLSHLEWGFFEQGVLTLYAPSLFIRDWIEKNYLESISRIFHQQWRECHSVAVSVRIGSGTTRSLAERGYADSFSRGEENGEEQELAGVSLDPHLRFENFVVGKPNEFAYAAAQRVSECDDVLYNPLFLYGPVGHGKTHLMHSIAHRILERFNHKKKVLYLSAEKFMYYFVRALRQKSVMAFKEQFRSVDVLIVDDVQFISGKDSTQEEFFHTFNTLVDQKRQIILSADKSPSDLDLKERLKSRLGKGLVADLHPTTYELRLGILQAKAMGLQCQVGKDILNFLASKISSNVRELEGALVRIAAHASLMGSQLSLGAVQDILKDLLRSCDREISVEEIQKKVSEYYKIKISDLNSTKRVRTIVRPRQVAMFLAKQLTTASLPHIGRCFGGRDHTTVIHGVSTIEGLIEKDKHIAEDVTLLRKLLEN